MTPEETSLRTLWTSQGVTQERQDAMIEWARAPFPPTGESFPVHQMGPDGKRKARYRGGIK